MLAGASRKSSRWRLPILALLFGLATLAGFATSAWGAQRIDGSSRANFERSVASLQKQLAPDQREELELALGVIWIERTAGENPDLDHDGNVGVDDIRALSAIASELLTEIQRGDLLSALEKREGKYGAYTVADYVDQLNGLDYDGVLALAMQPRAGVPPQAPTLAGIWYGVLPSPFRHSRVLGISPNRRRPLFLEVAVAADGTYSGSVNSVTQGTAVPMTDIVVDGSAVRWQQPSVTASYEGTLGADGSTLRGRFRQSVPDEFRPGKQSLLVSPLVFHKLQLR